MISKGAKICIQVSLAVRGGYVPENCREWQNRELQDVSSLRIVGFLDYKNDARYSLLNTLLIQHLSCT